MSIDYKKLYQEKYGVVDEGKGYSLTIKAKGSKIFIKKWYARNSWVDDKLEHSVIYENGKWTEI